MMKEQRGIPECFWWATTGCTALRKFQFPLVPYLWVEVLDQVSVWLLSMYYEPKKLLDDPHDFCCASRHHVSLSSVYNCALRLWGRGRRAHIQYSSTGFSCWKSCYLTSVSTIYLICVSVSPPLFPDRKRCRYVPMWTPLRFLEWINFSKQGIVLILSSWHHKGRMKLRKDDSNMVLGVERGWAACWRGNGGK